MTTRHHSLQVVLEEDVREDEIQPLLSAISHMRGVLRVVPVDSSFDSVMAEARAKDEMRGRLIKILSDLRNESR